MGPQTLLLFLTILLFDARTNGTVLYVATMYYKSATCSDPILYQNVSALGECINVYTSQGIESSSFVWKVQGNTFTYLVSSWKTPNCHKGVPSSITEKPHETTVTNGACVPAGTGSYYYKVLTQTLLTPPIDIAPSLVQWGYADSKSCMTQESPLSVLAYPTTSCVYIDVRHSMRYACSADGLEVTVLRFSNPHCSGNPLFKSNSKLSTDGKCVQYGDLGGVLQRSAPGSGDLSSRNFVTFSCCLKRGASSCSLYAPSAAPSSAPTTSPTPHPTNALMELPTHEVGKEPTEAPSELRASAKNSGAARYSLPSLWPTVIVSLLLAL